MTASTDIWSRSGPYRMTWSDFGELGAELERQIRRDGFAADLVCAVARGGLTIAGLLAAALGVDALHVVRVRRTVDDGVYAAKQVARLQVTTAGDLRAARRVLIVDDIVGSGATAELVHRHVADGGREVRMATLAYNPCSTYRPRYRAVEVDDWVVFPWEQPTDSAVGTRPLSTNRAET